MKTAAIQQDLLVAAVDALPDNGMREIRGDALTRFAVSGLPDTSNEDWRYTSLQPIVELSNAWLAGLAEAKAPGASAQTADVPRQDFESAVDAGWLRFLNGRLLGNVSSVPGRKDIHVNTAAHGSALHMGDGISSFNATLLNDAIRVSVPADTSLVRPIGLLLASDATDAQRVSATRIVLEVGSNSVVNILENHVSLSAAPAYANVVVELQIGKGARVNFLRLQECGDAQMLTEKLIASVSDERVVARNADPHGETIVVIAPMADLVQGGVCARGEI
jgi:Fe-S cluster assembly protein SufD